MKKETPVSDSGIYLDHNATTPVAPDVIATIRDALRTYGNASSRHPPGLEAESLVQRARQQVATLIGAQPSEIVFTSGGSESDNLALKGIAARQPGGHLISQATEHPAILASLQALGKLGYSVTILPVDAHGLVDPNAVERALRTDTILVSIQHANGETGTIQPLTAISQLLRPRGVLFHTDAAQSIGKIDTTVDKLGVDLMTIAGHKVYAPKGVGALYVRNSIELEPLIHGASHESGRRAGTEAVHQMAALGRACELAAESLGAVSDEVQRLRDLLHVKLRSAIPDIRVHGHPNQRLPNCLNVGFPAVDGSELLEHAPEIFASTGSACHEGSFALSPVLEAMGVSAQQGRGTVRLSLGRTTTEDEVLRAADSLIRAFRELTA